MLALSGWAASFLLPLWKMAGRFVVALVVMLLILL